MNNLIIASTAIRQNDGLYSLNDLHLASGGNKNHKPTFFLRNEQTRALITEIEQGANSQLAIKVKHGGELRGSFACKELVYAYAMWISPAFTLQVIRTFDALRTTQAPAALPHTLTINATQAGELHALIAERFPLGTDRPYAWGRFNNHFRLASYKDLPSRRFDEACAYITAMPPRPAALPAPAISGETLHATIARLANQLMQPNSYPAALLAPLVNAYMLKTGCVLLRANAVHVPRLPVAGGSSC